MLIIFATALTRVVYQPFIVHEQQLEWMQGSRDMIAIKRIKISEIFWEGGMNYVRKNCLQEMV